MNSPLCGQLLATDHAAVAGVVLLQPNQTLSGEFGYQIYGHRRSIHAA